MNTWYFRDVQMFNLELEDLAGSSLLWPVSWMPGAGIFREASQEPELLAATDSITFCLRLLNEKFSKLKPLVFF